VLDPHGAVAYVGLKRYLSKDDLPSIGVFLETAHPAKFLGVVEKSLGKKIELPHRLQNFMKGEKVSIAMSSAYEEFKAQLKRIL
jgi:threonine synthase